MESTTLTFPAMQNGAIAIAGASALESLAGVDNVHLTLAHAKSRINFDEAQATRSDSHAAVEQAGFSVNEAPLHESCCGGCGGWARR